MKIAKQLLCTLGLMLAASSLLAAEPMADVIGKDLAVAARQYSFLLDSIRGKPGLPRTLENGQVKLVGAHDWTSGFFPGSLWYLAEATGDARWRAEAARYTEATSAAKFDHSHHDL